METIKLKNSIKKLQDKRKDINNSLLTNKDRKEQLLNIKEKISILENKLNNITHFKEINKAKNMINTFGGCCFSWWDSPLNKFRIMLSHGESENIKIEVSDKKTWSSKSSFYSFNNKVEYEKAKEILANLMIDCVTNEK